MYFLCINKNKKKDPVFKNYKKQPKAALNNYAFFLKNLVGTVLTLLTVRYTVLT